MPEAEDPALNVEEETEESVEDGSDESPGDSGAEDQQEDAEDQFQVLSTGRARVTRKPVDSSLPEWLAHPSSIDHDLQRHQVSLDAIAVSDRMKKTLRRNGISSLFPVQAAIVKAIVGPAGKVPFDCVGVPPRDLCVSAPTGSGKTLAYGIPIIEVLSRRVVPRIRALVLLPSRDLARQVCGVLTSMASHTDLEVVLATGQTDFSKEQAELSDGLVDIVVATPGRLVDHISSTPGFSLKHLQFLVLDEADRLLDQPFQDWLGKVQTAAGVTYRRCTSALLENTNPQAQKLLFSATLTQDPEKLSKLLLFRPRLFTIVDDARQSSVASGNFAGRYSTPAQLKEQIIVCDGSQKPLLIYHLVKDKGFKHVLCFTGSLESTHRLYTLLEIMGGISVARFSSELTRGHRMRLLENFKLGRYQLLICSDAMARGMDIEKVEHVISYDAPQFIQTHIHRMGRTARAGRDGNGYTVLRSEEVRHYKAMMRAAGKETFKKLKVTEEDLEPHFDLYKEGLGKLEGALQAEKQKKRGKKRKRT